MKYLSNSTASFLVLLSMIGMATEASADSGYVFDLETISREMGMDLTSEELNQMRKESILGHRQYNLYINSQPIGLYHVEVVESAVTPSGFDVVLQAQVLQQLPLKFDELPELLEYEPTQEITQMTEVIPGATTDIDSGLQNLYITVPQIYFDEKKRVLMNPVLWDYGIPAVRVNYDFNTNVEKSFGQTNKRAFLSAESIFNLGAWRLYNRSTARYTESNKTDFERLNSYLTRVIPSMKARVVMGEISTYSRFMDSIPIIGVNIRDEEELVEPADRDYLPEITGIANSQALVTVRQGNKILLEQEVPPGPFELTDLLSLGYSGEIEVEVKEAGGQVRKWVVPYIRANSLLKRGRLVWSLAAGKLDNSYALINPWVFTASGGYGMPGGYTLSGGVIASDIFSHYRVGSVFDGGNWGSLSVFADHSIKKVNNRPSRQGTTLDVGWSKQFKKTNSSVNLSYRHTLDGTIGSLSEVASLNTDNVQVADWSSGDFVADHVMLTLSQSLGNLGSVSLSGLYEQSHQGNKYHSLSANYTVNIKGVSVSTFLQHTRQSITDGGGSSDDWQVNVGVSVPLSLLGSSKVLTKSSISSGISINRDGVQSKTVSMSGTFGEVSPFYWDVQYQQAKRGDPTYNANVSYSADSSTMRWSLGKSESVKSLGFSASGSMLMSQYGFHFSKQRRSSMALVYVPGAHEVSLSNDSHSSKDEWLVVDSLQNYRKNTIHLNAESLPANMTLKDGLSADLCPADNAVLFYEFKNFLGTESLFTLKTNTGDEIPFGAEVRLFDQHDEREQTVSDDGGVVYFSAAPKLGTIKARWRDGEQIKSCKASYEISSSKDSQNLYRETLKCIVQPQESNEGVQ